MLARWRHRPAGASSRAPRSSRPGCRAPSPKRPVSFEHVPRVPRSSALLLSVGRQSRPEMMQRDEERESFTHTPAASTPRWQQFAEEETGKSPALFHLVLCKSIHGMFLSRAPHGVLPSAGASTHPERSGFPGDVDSAGGWRRRMSSAMDFSRRRPGSCNCNPEFFRVPCTCSRIKRRSAQHSGKKAAALIKYKRH